MRILVTSGSKHGGTRGIAEMIAAALRDAKVDVDLDVEVRDAREVDSCAGFDAAIVGGALYANRWHRHARRFVARHLTELRRVPVWLFSSGPLDDSAARAPIPPVTEVAVLMERVGALGHATFGGRLALDVTGFPAQAMARSHSGDWRDPARIRAWAFEIAARLPSARPAAPIIHPARSLPRVAGHAVVGWSACAAIMAGLLATTSLTAATIVHSIAAPLVFVAVAKHYFGARGARGALPVALAFTAIVATLDLAVVAVLIRRSFAMFESIGGTWLPLALIFLVTWVTGAIMATLPWPQRSPTMTPSTPGAAHT